ncbi:type 11 methyltransferase [Halovivax asiaticus JCM 14624]|uniref:Type 11 methyltransferase n=1 Tax=Halovivax asiaticus JCM 14624 TaxID=1227490 RepID=M0BV89_9EURY|nr:class I SAM-dependent methyltransferase [Halovivax asiaticus]ELZ14002.1 type 11 methyltransferase [Halovivax asiaticus JCM 14624]
MSETFDNTIDWEGYWTESADVTADDANGSVYQAEVADAVFGFVAQRETPDRCADVGCGGGALAARLAEQYPETTVVGYDAAESVVERNSERVRVRGPDNVRFERVKLPDFDPDEPFDLVTCFFTLCYVADVERALTSLYDAVVPGGYLLFTYHNRLASSLFQDIAASPEDFLDESSAWSPNTFPERFQLVIDGENLLSYDRIENVLGVRPRSLWSTVDGVERYGAWRQNPLVYVPNPASDE